MLKTFTPNLKKLLVPLAVQCMLFVCVVATGYGQGRETIFQESFGIGAVPSALADYTDYTHNTSAAISGTASIKGDSPSDYSGASAGNNADFTKNQDLIISGLNTEGYSTVDLAFGVFRTTGAALTVEYRIGTGSWVAVPSLAVSGAAGWTYLNSQDNPFPKVANWSLRFSHTGSRGTLKIDDINLSGGISTPTITNIAPQVGGIGTEVTVSGYNLESVFEIYFVDPAKSAYAYDVTSTSFKFRVPAGASTSMLEFYDATAEVLLAVSSEPFEVIIPTITIIDPIQATPGTLITITGTNLEAANTIIFGGAGNASPASVPTATQVQVVVPANAESGRVDVVTSNYGTAYSSQNFTVLKPSITRIENASGTTITSAREGASITIVGTRLNIGGTPTVVFGGGIAASVTSVSETKVVVTVPAGAQTGSISLTTTESSATSASFTIIKPSITITGTPLAAFQSVENTASAVQQYTVSGTNLTGGITVSAPAHFQISTDNVNFGQTASLFLQPGGNASGTVYVRYLPTAVGSHTGFIVHESSGISESVQVQGTATEASLAITSVNPTSAKLNQTITINGTKLNVGGNPVVTFTGGATGTVISASATAIDVRVPTAAQTGPITVTTSEGTATSASFTVLSPVVTITQSLSPFSTVAGKTTASQQYTVRGTNIATNLTITAPANFEVSVNNFTFSSSVTMLPSAVENTNKAIYVRYKPTAVGNHSGNLVHTTEGATESFAISGTAVEPLSITSLSPNNGAVGATVQINGYRLNQGGTPTVVFGGGVAATVSSATATAVIVTVPAGAQTGAISLTTTEGTVTSGTFTVTPTLNVSGTLTSFSTTVGEASAVQNYSISGTNFTDKVTVSAPLNFQVSLSSDGGFGTSVDVIPGADGSIPATPIYVRYYATTAGSHSGNITNASAGVSTVNVAVQGEATPPEGAPLPVELASFTYVQQQDGVLLEWKTASEKDNSHFDVEMSYDPTSGFEKIGRVDSKVVNSATLTKYQYKHSYTTGGTRYYRLKQVDLDGTSEYSNVLAVESVVQVVESVTVAPNPINYNSKVFVTALSEGKAVVRLYSLEGKQIYTREAAVRKGENEIQLPVYDLLTKGVYMLTVELNGTVHKVKVLKQ
ncbi:IPT/TIG domain-containing protein [Botryobacter ruber]|uniref:IPT/TIG domain-containing protein n=1 Tax=Botryobacter ruber TaxID=2171629 RepID=UPI000E0C2C1E|nr:IPT/TIG domain-containing protein [Botryobacter ruber]